MTGFGNASLQTEGVHVSSEIKSVNNRYLKISVRMPDSVARFEAEIEKLVRSRVTRGSVQLSIRVRFTSGQSEYRIDQDLLRGFQRQLSEISGDAKGSSATLGELLSLPGVVSQTELPEEFERRLRARGTESEEVIQRRLATAEKELQLADRYKYVVVNDQLETAVSEICEILKAEEKARNA